MKEFNKSKKGFSTIALLLLICAVVLLSPLKTEAQSQWLDYGTGNSLSLEIYKPFIPRDSVFDEVTPSYKPFSVAMFLTGRYNLNENITLVADIPFARGEIDDTTALPDDNGSEIGNPYLGAEYKLKDSPLRFELGFRIPLTPKDRIYAALTGIRSDLDRIEAFIYNLVPVTMAINFETLSETSILFKARLAGNLWFIEDPERTLVDEKTQFGVGYTVQTGYIHKHVNVIFGLSGRYHLESGPRLQNKPTALQYGLMVTVPYKNIRPGLSIKVPGNDRTGKLFNYILGFNFTYIFEK